MARISLNGSTKFKKLVHAVRIPAPYVRGLLETLWEAVHASGNPIVGDADSVEVISDWPGERGAWFKVLSENNWIEKNSRGEWMVHDYFVNCPEFVIKRIASAKGIPYKGLRLRLIRRFRNPTDSIRNFSDCISSPVQTSPNQTKPNQSKPNQTKPDTMPADAALRASFDSFWNSYPRKTDKTKALNAWRRLKPPGELADTILAAVASQKKSDQWQRGIVPHAATWLTGKRWEDEVCESSASTNRKTRVDEVSERFLAEPER